MLDFLKRKTITPSQDSLFSRLKSGITRSRRALADGLSNLILGKKNIDAELLEELEALLLTSDIGVDTTASILATLTAQVKRKELNDPKALHGALLTLLEMLLTPSEAPLVILEDKKPFVILMVGINGAGKTTTIAKLTQQFQTQGKKVMLAAGDTFRAAAIEQLHIWGERHNVPVIAQHQGADSASVVFDAFQAAKARGMDILIADTAGRLHTQAHLMTELEKIVRVLKKLDDSAPHEMMLVLDASIGQNALAQAKLFHKSVGITGITITKLDGTAKGGIMFAIAQELKLPIRFIGVGESAEDLQPFRTEAFVQALLTEVSTE